MPVSHSRDFAQVLADLRDDERPFPAFELYQLSDLDKQDLDALEAVWPEIPLERRRSTMQDLTEIAEANFEVNFRPVFRLGLEDDDAKVRAASIGGLWEEEDTRLIAPFLDFLNHDPDVNVRAAAARALGRFVYLGEVEEIAEAHLRRIESALLAVINDPQNEPDLRRRALEAVAFSGREEVSPLIEAAYLSSEPKYRASAVFAMGRSADKRWAPQVLAELENGAPELRFEAARAAGELELPEAVPALARLAEDGDQQIREAAIWSLGQVGGPEAREALGRLLEAADEEDRDFIGEALENLDFTDEVQDLARIVLDDEGEFEDEDEDDEIDKSLLN